MMHKETSNKSFTVLELLIVIAIIGILASVVFVRFKGASERARLSNAMQFADTLRASLQADMVAWWTMDKIENGKTPDNFFNHLDGTVYGPTQADGVVNGALEFNGSNDYVKIPHDDSLNAAMGKTTNFTIAAWIYPKQWINYGAINKTPEGCWYDSTNGLWTYSGGFRCVMGHGGPEGCNPPGGGITIGYKPPLNKWYHVVCTGDGTDMRMYVNGKLVGTDSISKITVQRHDNTAPLTIGKRTPTAGGAISGFVDEVQLYSRALPPIAIQYLYAQGRKAHPLASAER